MHVSAKNSQRFGGRPFVGGRSGALAPWGSLKSGPRCYCMRAAVKLPIVMMMMMMKMMLMVTFS